MTAPRSRFRRWLRRALTVGGPAAAVAAGWFLFLPVPLGWAARLALRITLPPAAGGARVRIAHATFRFGGFGPAVRLDLAGVDVEGAGGQLARHLEHVEVRFAKRALWRRNWAPSLIAVSRPVLTIDLTRPAAPAPVRPPAGAPVAGPAIRLAALRAFIPLPDNPCRFVVTAPALELRTPGRAVHWQFQDVDTAFAREGDRVRFSFPIALANTRRPVALRCSFDGALPTGLVDFSVGMAPFSSEDLPALPLLPGESERSRFRVGLSLDGRLRLDQLRLQELAFAFLGEEGEFHLPGVKSAPIRVQRIELRGRVRDDFRFVHLDVAVLALDSLRLDASGLELETGPAPRVDAHVVVTGPTGADIAAYLPPAVAAALPFNADALRQLQVRSARLDVKGSARVGPGGHLAAQALAGDGRIDLGLNGDDLPLSFDVRCPGPGQPIETHLRVPAFSPARLRLAALEAFAPLAALDAPVNIEATAEAAALDDWRTATVEVRVGRGRLNAFGPLRRPLTVTSAAARAEVSERGQAFRLRDLQVDLGGPRLFVPDLTGSLSGDGVLTVRGSARIEGVDGEWVARCAPPDIPAALTALGLSPRDVRGAQLAASFTGRRGAASARPAPPFAGELEATIGITVRGEPLAATVHGDLDAATGALAATAEVAEFHPARLGLSLPGGLSSASLDVPVKLGIRIAAEPAAGLRSAAISLATGAGALRLRPFFDGDIPVNALTCDASFDPARHAVDLHSLNADLGGWFVRAAGVSLQMGAQPSVAGSLEIADATIARILRVWPRDLQPVWRERVEKVISAGAVTRARLKFAAPLTWAALEDFRPTSLAGEILVDGLQGAWPGTPAPFRLGRLAVAADYPAFTVTLSRLSSSGFSLTDVTARTADFRADPCRVETAFRFDADLAAAPAWAAAFGSALPPDLPLDWSRLAGTASGDVRAALPLAGTADLEAVDATVRAQIDGLTVPLTYPGARLGGGRLALSAQARRGALTTTIDWGDLAVALPDVVTGRLTLHASSVGRGPDSLELSATLAAGRETRLLRQPAAATAFAPVTIEARLSGWRSQAQTRARIEASSADFLGGPLAATAEATIGNAAGRLESAAVPRLRLGRTDLSADYASPAAGRTVLTVKGARLDISDWARWAAPFLSRPAPPAADRPAAPPPRPAHPAASVATAAQARFPDLRASVAIGDVEFGDGRLVRDLHLTAHLLDDEPREVTFDGRENGANPLNLTVRPKGDGQELDLTVGDSTAWLQTLLQPLRGVTLPPGDFAAMADDLAELPVLFGGGRLELHGALRLADPARLFDGQCRLSDTVIRQTPRVLKLIALRSGKQLRERPLIKEISASRLFASNALIALEGIKSDAASLSYLRLNFLRYGLADDSLHLDGAFAGVGFEVLGTRASPQIFLKNNLLVRAVGSEPEFTFGEIPTAPAPPPRRD